MSVAALLPPPTSWPSARAAQSRHLGVPDVMLRAERDRFLDDWTIQDLEKGPESEGSYSAASGGGELVKALLAPRLG